MLNSQGITPRVVVVDNASTDDSAERIRAALPDVPLIVAPSNEGYASGANLGLRWALEQGLEYLLLLNNDTVVDPCCVEQLVDALQEDSALGMAGPMVFHADEPDRIWYLADRRRSLWPVPQSLGREQIDRGQFPARVLADYVSGCAMMIRRSTLERVGLLEERLFMHYEDADFCWRVRRASLNICAVPARAGMAQGLRQRRAAGAVHRLLPNPQSGLVLYYARIGPHAALCPGLRGASRALASGALLATTRSNGCRRPLARPAPRIGGALGKTRWLINSFRPVLNVSPATIAAAQTPRSTPSCRIGSVGSPAALHWCAAPGAA